MTADNDEPMIVPGLLSRYVRLSTGVKVHYVTAGETGPDVILLHGGLPGSSGTAGFRFMAPFLAARGFRVHCPDQPGFGLTEDPAAFYSYGQGASVDFVQDFVNALALESFHIGGNSLGCTNSVNYTLAHPERVMSFAVIAGGLGDIVPRAKMNAADPRSAEERPVLPTWDGTTQAMRGILSAVILDQAAVTDALVTMRTAAANRHAGEYERNFERWRAPNMGGGDRNELVRLRTTDRLNRLQIPGIYLHGRDDVMMHVTGAYLLEDALPNLQFFYPEHSGHQGQTDQPALFNQVFLEFFSSGKVSASTAKAAGVSDRRPVNPDLVDDSAATSL